MVLWIAAHPQNLAALRTLLPPPMLEIVVEELGIGDEGLAFTALEALEREMGR